MKKLPIVAVAIAVLAATACGQTTIADEISVYKEPAQLRELLLDAPDDLFLVDVRTPAEYESGHIPGALNTEYQLIAGNLPTEDRDALVVVYCRSGRRSGVAAQALISLGYTRVVDWGGVVRWPYDLASGSEPGMVAADQ